MRRGVSVKDVAARAGVALGTVSNVMNHPERVSEVTRQRVHAAMSELGFVRNESARALRSGASSTVAYLMLDAANPFFHDVATGIDEVIEHADLSLYICNSNNQRERESLYVARLEQQRVQGLLVTPADADRPLFRELAERGTPVVFVDRAPTGSVLCAVTVDDVLGGKLAARHLIGLGHQRIAFIGGPESIGQVRDRRSGVLTAWKSARRRRSDCLVISPESLTVASGREAARQIIEMPPGDRPTGVVCANDLIALGVLQESVRAGLIVPDDLSIVGYDDIEFAGAAAVPLTSVRQPREDLGRRSAELLLDEVRNPRHLHQHLTFEPELIVRESTAPPRHAGGRARSSRADRTVRA